MKKISFVSDTALTTVFDEPMLATRTCEGVSETFTVVETHLHFLLERIADGAFTKDKSGIDAIEFVVAARAEIRDQAEAARERGYWLIEDERATAFERATLHPQNDYRPDIRHNLLPFLLAAKNAEKAP